jgi:hypothetical protein
MIGEAMMIAFKGVQFVLMLAENSSFLAAPGLGGLRSSRGCA